MHPKALLDACSDLVRQALTFEHPADAVLSRFFRQHGKSAYGSRERAVLAETLYHVLRHKLRFEHFAPSDKGPRERRLAILGFAMQLVGGTLVALDYQRSFGAGILIVFTVAATAIFHQYWRVEDPLRRHLHFSNIFSNCGLIGGLLLLV